MFIFRVPHEPIWNNYLTTGHAEAKGKPACFQVHFQQQEEMSRVNLSEAKPKRNIYDALGFMCKASQVTSAFLGHSVPVRFDHGPYPAWGDK